MTIAEDLLALLGGEVQAAGAGEVDPAPASTRGTAHRRDPDGRRQAAFVRVDTAPPWPTVWDPLAPWPTWDGWRAEVARRTDAADAACGAASTPYVPDSDEVELEQQRKRVLLRVRDGDGVVWKDCPEWEVEDLPQPVTVLAREERPIYTKPKVAPVVKLAAARIDRRPSPRNRQKMTPAQVDRHLARVGRGESIGEVAKSIWKQHGFSSMKSCETSLRRQLNLRAEAQREEVAA